jgi:hypothetical protein
MKDRFNIPTHSDRAIIGFTIIAFTVLICTSSLSQILLISASNNSKVLAVAAGNGANVTKSNNFVTKNESQNGSSSVTGSRTDSNSKTLQYISNVQQHLNQTLGAYQKQNYTGALTLAAKAYLDNFEFVEGPLQQHDKTLKQNTEFMIRGDLRQQIKHKAPLGDIQTLISKININLERAEKILSAP